MSSPMSDFSSLQVFVMQTSSLIKNYWLNKSGYSQLLEGLEVCQIRVTWLEEKKQKEKKKEEEEETVVEKEGHIGKEKGEAAILEVNEP